VTVKFEEVPGNKTQLNLFQGSFYNFLDPNYVDDDKLERKFVYDDSVILTFNNNLDSSIAAMSVAGEDSENFIDEYLAQFDVPTLTGE